jgi:hypothetical protein
VGERYIAAFRKGVYDAYISMSISIILQEKIVDENSPSVGVYIYSLHNINYTITLFIFYSRLSGYLPM